MTSKWDSMSLTDRTKAVNNLRTAFENYNRAVSTETLVKLAKWCITPSHLELRN
jgi:hypothetical protein